LKRVSIHIELKFLYRADRGPVARKQGNFMVDLYTTRIRFSDIHNPTLGFMHRWLPFTLFPTWELHSVTVAEFRSLYTMARKIRYSLVADIVDCFKEIRTLSGPIKCTSMVIQIALNLGCPMMAHMSYIEGDVPILGLTHFVHAHILREEPEHV
jgi:hypothetical protein